jgi:2-amino-4-hydroxy-6-hydroxymethyldihydropteridine diphosphokinase
VNLAYISAGSNIDPERNLPQAVAHVASRCRVLAVSAVYETDPVGKADQPSFLNAAMLVQTDLAAAELKSQVLQAVESELGRIRTQDKNAPRTIDLDVSLFNTDVLQVGQRRIPDPEILLYPHITKPLADLAPHYRHPITGQTLLEIAQSLPQQGLLVRSDIVLETVPQVMT